MEHSFRKALALADAELSASEVPALVQELARNPSLVRALQVYIAVGRGRLAKPYAAMRDEAVPQRLIDTVMRTPMAGPLPRSFGLATYGGALLRRLKHRYTMPGWSLAAGPAVAAVLVAVSAWLMVPNSSHGETLLAAQLQRAIETTRSGSDAPLLTFRPVLSYQNKNQDYCRQFEVRSGTERSAGLACRERTGKWQIVMRAPLSPVGPAPAGSGREELERYVASTISGQPLGSEQVAKLIEEKWR